MRLKLLTIVVALLAMATNATAQVTNDTIYNPKVIFSGMPQKYEIAGIKVTGVDNYEDYIIIGYSGLSVGQKVEIPGDEIKMAAKRFWRQQLFSSVKIKVEKICGDKAWLEIELRQQPRISEINYIGMKKGEREDIQLRLGLTKGNQITPNIAARARQIIEKYYDGKGFKNATVRVDQKEDLSKKNEVIVDIVVDKHDKVKVHKIYIDGNKVLSDGKLKPTEIELGIDNGIDVVVVNGLSEGDVVAQNYTSAMPQEAQQQGGGESNPFMPKPPQRKSNKK